MTIRFTGDVGGISLIPGSERSSEKEMATHSSILGSENPIDRGARHAIVHGVAKSQTQLSTHTHTHTHTHHGVVKSRTCLSPHACINFVKILTINRKHLFGKVRHQKQYQKFQGVRR